jgi:hypothetical protein
MVCAIDGSGEKTMEVTLHKNKVGDIMERLVRIRIRLNRLSDIPKMYCLVCSAIAAEKVTHLGGCTSTYNMCFKCLGQHRSLSCSGRFFKVAPKFCWKCWMPLYDIFGVSFHSNKKDDLINCSSAARDFLKPLAMVFFYNRRIASISCPCGDISQYERWLFSESEQSVAGIGQMPNILLLLEDILEQNMSAVFV